MNQMPNTGAIALLLAAGLAGCATTPTSPAMEAAVTVRQEAFRGYDPGDKELRERLKQAGKYASPEEVEQVLRGQKEGWMVVDIRSPDQHAGGQFRVDGAEPLYVGREEPTETIAKALMTIKDGQVVKASPANVIVMCRSGLKSAFEYGAYATAGFNDVKIAGVADWAKSCRGLATSSKIEDVGISKMKLTRRKDGLYYSDQCPATAGG